MEEQPEVWVVGGCNGSGKTTFALSVLSNLEGLEFVNADMIAADLNPQDVDAVAIQASRLMLARLRTLAQQRVDFAFETTLAARSFASFLKRCQSQGYRVNLIYVWLNSVDLGIARVASRVASGGHNIPEDVIRRRYERGQRNFLELYSPLVDRWQAYDNSENNQLIAYRNGLETKIIKEEVWQEIFNG